MASLKNFRMHFLSFQAQMLEPEPEKVKLKLFLNPPGFTPGVSASCSSTGLEGFLFSRRMETEWSSVFMNATQWVDPDTEAGTLWGERTKTRPWELINAEDFYSEILLLLYVARLWGSWNPSLGRSRPWDSYMWG